MLAGASGGAAWAGCADRGICSRASLNRSVKLSSRKPTSGGRARCASRRALAAELTLGESLAVNGVCLTVIAHDAHRRARRCRPGDPARHDARAARAGQPVNLERPMRADSRFGGHFVQGHVDAIGHIDESMRPDAEFHW